MIRLIAGLIALPIHLAGRLVGLVNHRVAVGLLALAWRIGGDGRVAVQALAQVLQAAGSHDALALASRWLQARPRVEVAAFAGLLSLRAGDRDGAHACLAAGLGLGPDRDGHLDLLELTLACADESPGAAEAVAVRFEARSDLNPTVRRMVLYERMWGTLLRRDFDRARRYARRLLAVDEDRFAHLALFALRTRDGNLAQAERHLAAARGLPADQQLYSQYLGLWAVGEADRAAEALDRLREANPHLCEQARREVAYREAAP